MRFKLQMSAFLLSAVLARGDVMHAQKMIRSTKDRNGKHWCIGLRMGTNKLETKHCDPRDPDQRFDLEEVDDGGEGGEGGEGGGGGGGGRWRIHPAGKDDRCFGLRRRTHGRRLREEACGEEPNQVWSFPKKVGDNEPDGIISMTGEGGGDNATAPKLCVTNRGAVGNGKFIIVKTSEWATQARNRGRQFLEHWHVPKRVFPETAE